jgi:Tfp pilus assembly protein PilO
MQQASIDKRLQNSIALVLLMLILILAVFFLLIKPTAIGLKQTNIDLGAKRAELKAKEEKLVQLQKLEKELPEIEKRSASLDKALPSKADLPGILVQIEAIAKKHKIALAETTTVQPVATTNNLGIEGDSEPASTVAVGPTTKEVKFSFGMTGKYGEIIKFLETLQENLRIFKLDTLQITGPSDDSPDFQVTTQITTFYID